MLKKNLQLNEKILVLIILVFSIIINQYYANRGVFPIESFAHFDIAFRIINGDIPFQDYWLVSGLLIDYVQAFFFKVFGQNFQVYIFHASLINCLLTITTFYILKNFNLNIYQCVFYSFCFAILGYTTSGTLYVDHHSSLLCLLAVFCLIMAIKTERRKFLILLPIILGLAFLTKSAPSVYVFFSVSLILILYILIEKKFNWLLYLFLSSISFIILTVLLFNIANIKLENFFNQYIFFPSSIGKDRITELNFLSEGVIFDYKFIYISFIPLLTITLLDMIKSKKNIFNENFFFFLSFLLLILSLVIHQINTRNQEFIFFLIPVLCAFSSIFIYNYEIRYKKYFSVFLLLFCLFVTSKYHLRFNDERKFHEMSKINFDLSVDAKKIDKKLSGLKWITPIFPNSPEEEVKFLREIIGVLNAENSKAMVMSNYSFLSLIIDKNLHSPSRWYIPNGAAYPIENNKYFDEYKNFLIDLITRKKVSVIYIISPVKVDELYRYVSKNCFEEDKTIAGVKKLLIKDCLYLNKPI